jgi:hypothetical protein
VAGRALAFADAEIIRLARDEYVAVTGDDWYERRRQDDEGRFFRGVANQGPRKGPGGATRQGIYLLTADGKLLAYKNCGQSPEATRDLLQQGLREWRKLTAERRQAGAVRVGEPGTPDRRYHRPTPPGATIVNVHARCLDRDSGGALCSLDPKASPGHAASRDHLWVTSEDTAALVPAEPRKGARSPVPANLAQRILRFHLLDNTRGEPNYWERRDLRKWTLTVEVQDAIAERIELVLRGNALLATHDDPSQAKRGYEAQLLGYLSYDVPSRSWRRFDFVAVGEHWGHGTYTPGARPGRTPLGVAFELAKGTSAADRVPPQAARTLDEYLRPAGE